MTAPTEPWFVYIARCADGSLYTGIALSVERRIAEHDAGRGARYTRGRGPLALVAQHRCSSKADALRLEIAVKRLARIDKERLAVGRTLAAFARTIAAARRELTRAMRTKRSRPKATPSSGKRRPS
jgi:putative endonuclease